MPCSWRSSATSRCTGSVWALPAVVASSCAALIASTLRVVNFEASMGGPLAMVRCHGAATAATSSVQRVQS